MSPSPFERATNPQQYDLPDVQWSPEVGLESPFRAFFWRCLAGSIKDWQDVSVLDVGAGSGWALQEAKKYRAKKFIGVEPSRNNIRLGKKYFPDIPLIESTLEEYQAEQKFNVIMCIMSFPHIADLKKAFAKIADLLEERGRCFIIVPDFDYYKKPRHDYKIETEERTPDEFVVSVTRSTGTLADIVRRNSVYIDVAKEAQLILESATGMKPDAELMAQRPNYQAFASMAICQLLVFRKPNYSSLQNPDSGVR